MNGAGQAELPPDAELVRTTPTFDQDTVPAGLIAEHRVADGVWGRLVVHSGALTFTFADSPGDAIAVSAGGAVVIPPQRAHQLSIQGPVTFAVEFHRVPASG